MSARLRKFPYRIESEILHGQNKPNVLFATIEANALIATWCLF
jgi:hypothetical protein